MGIMLSTQELADLARVDPLFADQVLANTNVKIVHRQNVPKSAERLSGVLGTYQAWERSYVERDALLSLLTRTPLPWSGPAGSSMSTSSTRTSSRRLNADRLW
jgi:hypothetical protein